MAVLLDCLIDCISAAGMTHIMMHGRRQHGMHSMEAFMQVGGAGLL